MQQGCQDVAVHLSSAIAKLAPFELWNDGTDIPVFAWYLKDPASTTWTLYDLADRLRMKGWIVPAYPMPVALTDLTVQRIVVRNGLSKDLADKLLADIEDATTYLQKLTSPMPDTGQRSSFHH